MLSGRSGSNQSRLGDFEQRIKQYKIKRDQKLAQMVGEIEQKRKTETQQLNYMTTKSKQILSRRAESSLDRQENSTLNEVPNDRYQDSF